MSVTFSKWDVKYFYMAGSHEQLISAVLPCFESERKKVSEYMLWLILGHQFVTDGQGVYQIMEGTGTGMRQWQFDRPGVPQLGGS